MRTLFDRFFFAPLLFEKFLLGVLAIAFASVAVTQAQAKAPFTAEDWAALHSASATAVASDGAILYRVSYGAEKGPTHNEWWTIGADGAHAAKLKLAEDFTPMGFSRDGHSLYGAWTVNHHRQFAIFPIEEGKAAAAPSTVVVLPRGIGSASPSPDGKRFAIAADPRPPDPLEDIRHVHEPEQTSIYVVNADGTSGTWWCSNLKSISGGLVLGGGAGAVAWSADSHSLALLSDLPRIGHHDVSTAIDICSASGSRHIADIPNSVSGIAWANGGSEIAFLSTKSAVLTPEHVWTVPASGGSAEDRTADLKGTATQLVGDTQGHVWVLVDHGVQNEVDEFRDGALKPHLSLDRWCYREHAGDTRVCGSRLAGGPYRRRSHPRQQRCRA